MGTCIEGFPCPHEAEIKKSEISQDLPHCSSPAHPQILPLCYTVVDHVVRSGQDLGLFRLWGYYLPCKNMLSLLAI